MNSAKIYFFLRISSMLNNKLQNFKKSKITLNIFLNFKYHKFKKLSVRTIIDKRGIGE